MPHLPTHAPVETPAKQEISFDLADMQPWREYIVTLFNDDFHSMDAVVAQIVKALQCPVPRAHAIMFEAHTNGRATVIITHRERAVRVAAVLKEIQLVVTVRQIN